MRTQFADAQGMRNGIDPVPIQLVVSLFFVDPDQSLG